MSGHQLDGRVVSLEAWRDAQRELKHEQRIRALELGWAKVAGGAAVGSIVGGGIVALLINQLGG